MGASLGLFSSSSNPGPSSVSANAPTAISVFTMTLSGSVTNMGHLTTVEFEYGTSSTLASYTTVTASESPVSSSGTSSFTRAISGLTSYTTYYYRIKTTTAGVILRSSITSATTYSVPSYTDSALARPRVGVAYSDSVSAVGNPTPTYSVTSGSLPTGLSLNATTGAVTGTPANTDEFSFTITASNSVGSINQSYVMLISTGIEGGTETNNGSVRIHTFYGAGSVTKHTPGVVSVVGYLVAGGGAGGSSVGGGGGGGRFSGGNFFIAQNTSISCTIGAGGARQTSYFGGQGADGSATTLTTPTISGYQNGATFTNGGGGGGGFYNANAPTAGTSRNASTEGSGGGGSGGVNGASSLGGGGATSGGRGQTFTNGRYVAGGGGGYSTNGADGSASDGTSGRGGSGGYLSYTATYYAAGGGGGGDAIATVGGTGDVAGTSGNTTGNNGNAFTGGGGGGCRNASGGVSSGAGASGTVIIVYQR